MPTYDIIYSKFLRLAATVALGVKILFQLVAILVFKEEFSLWLGIMMALDAAAALLIFKGDRSFVTALPFLGAAVLDNILFFCSIDLPGSTAMHLLGLFLMALIFILSMAGRMYENRGKLIFIFALLIAAYAGGMFIAVKGLAENPLTVSMVRVTFLEPVVYGLAAAWASFPRFRHHLTPEQVEERLEQNRTMQTTGMISVKEYNTTASMLLKCGEKKK